MSLQEESHSLAGDCQPSTLNALHHSPEFVERNANSRTYKNTTVKGPSSAVSSASPTPTVLPIATLLLSIMLSRFSSLFTYVIVGLVVSAAATPLNPLGDALGTKALSRPNSMKSNEKGQPMGGDRDKGKPMGMGSDRDMGKPMGMGGDRDNGKPMGMGGDRDMGKPDGDRDGGDRDKGKPDGDNDNKSFNDNDKPYGNKDKHYDDDRSERHGQCSVEKQHCCNQVNQVNLPIRHPLFRH